MLKSVKQSTKDEKIDDLLKNGYPAYTTQIGWLGYSDSTIRQLCKEYLQKGFTAFKIKVGQNLQSDIKRCRLVRAEIGWKNKLVGIIFYFFYQFFKLFIKRWLMPTKFGMLMNLLNGWKNYLNLNCYGSRNQQVQMIF